MGGVTRQSPAPQIYQKFELQLLGFTVPAFTKSHLISPYGLIIELCEVSSSLLTSCQERGENPPQGNQGCPQNQAVHVFIRCDFNVLGF